MHNSFCYLFVLLIDLFLPHGSPLEVGATGAVADVAHQASVGGVVFECFFFRRELVLESLPDGAGCALNAFE
jgi:hypothetical protein